MNHVSREQFPRTVSACHAEIEKLLGAGASEELEAATAELRAVRTELETVIAEAESLRAEKVELEGRVEQLEAEAEDRHDPIKAINRFLDEVERPTGRFQFDVVHGPRTDRAILDLFDAAERHP